MSDTTNSYTTAYKTVDPFDRVIGSLIGLPEVLNTAPTTVRTVTPMTGQSATFIVQTFRQENGETVFLEHVDEKGTTRLVIPPAVTKVIARHRTALSQRLIKRSAKKSAADRKAAGIKPAFLKKKGGAH